MHRKLPTSRPQTVDAVQSADAAAPFEDASLLLGGACQGLRQMAARIDRTNRYDPDQRRRMTVGDVTRFVVAITRHHHHLN